MNLRPMLIVNGVLIAAMAGASAWAWGQLPDSVPVHWNIDGKVDRFGSKAELLILLPAITAFITVLLAALPRLDPRRANIEASAKFWNAASIMPVALMAYVHGLMIWNAMGHQIDMINALIPGLSLLFIGIGNYLGKTRSNWFGGVRTPWTMSSEYAWERTHRWAGRLFVLSGALGFATWFAFGAKVAFFTLIGAIMVSAVATVVLSYVFWRADPDRQANGG